MKKKNLKKPIMVLWLDPVVSLDITDFRKTGFEKKDPITSLEDQIECLRDENKTLQKENKKLKRENERSKRSR